MSKTHSHRSCEQGDQIKLTLASCAVFVGGKNLNRKGNVISVYVLPSVV